MVLSRRHFLGASALAMAGGISPALASPPLSTKEPKTIRPPRLAPGTKVMLFAPAGALGKSDSVEEAVDKLHKLDLEVELAPHLRSRYGYLAGTDEERAQDVNEAFARPDIGGLIAIRGGYGCARILPHLDFAAIRKNPKPLTGYSDLTALHLALLARSGLITFHGPVAGSTFTDYSRQSWFGNLRETTTPLEMPVLPDVEPPKMLESLDRGGAVRGRLIGGNLTVFMSLFGTPYMPKLEGAILFFEDIGEEAYRIDRMLTQLRLAGVMDRISGLIFGRFTNADPKDPDDTGAWTVDHVLQERTRDLKIPVAAGFAIGHVAEKLTLAQGAKYELNPAGAKLTRIEPCVR